MSQDILVDDFTFKGKFRIPADSTTAHGNPWVKKVTGAGPPSANSNAGFLDLALEATSEVQNLCMYFGDELAYAIDKLVSFDIWAKCTASLPAAVTVSFGLANARNDAIASITNACLFQLAGSNAVKLLCTDGTNVLAATALGSAFTLSTTVRRFSLDFGTGVKTAAAPSLSTGGKANILASAENSAGLLRRVLPNTQISLGAQTGGMQPFVQIQKTSGTAVGTFSVERIRIAYRQG